MTFLRRRPGSSVLFTLVGDRGVGLLKKGELEGVKRSEWWFILDSELAADYTTVAVRRASIAAIVQEGRRRALSLPVACCPHAFAENVAGM